MRELEEMTEQKTEVKLKKVGADAGNNALKMAIEGSENILIPTISSLHLEEKSALMDMEDIPTDELAENIDITVNSKAMLFNNKRYIVGQKVITDRLTEHELEEKSDKATDELVALVTLAGLTVDAIRDNPNEDNISAHYDLGLALPVLTISPESAKQNSERFIGVHEVIYHHPSGRDVKVTITIEYAKTLPEGGAAAWGVVFDTEGNVIERKVEVGEHIQKTNFLHKTLLHFDIGSGTTEQVVTNGVKFIPTLSTGLGYGVKKTINEIIEIWNHKYPRKAIDSITEFNNIYFDQEHPRHNELRKLSEQSLLSLAQKISQSIINKIDKQKDEPFSFIYGGGAAILNEYLRKILESKNRIKNVIFLNEPMFVNANGLLVYLSSPRFEEQKKKALGVA